MIESRPFAGETDVPALHALLTRCEAHDQLDEHLNETEVREEFTDVEPGWIKSAHVWLDGRKTIACAGLWAADEREADPHAYGWYNIHPAYRSPELFDELFAKLEALARDLGEPLAGLELSAKTHARWKIENHERAGFQEVRRFMRMQRDLALPIAAHALKAGYTIRQMAGSEEVPAWIECFNASFVDHWGFIPDTVERRLTDLQKERYRPEWDLVAVASDGSIAGFCWCDSREPRPGEIEYWVHLLGTHREQRRKGLASALLSEGLQALRDAGATEARLSVDQQSSTGATTLYERNGFMEQSVTIVSRRPRAE